MASFTELVNRGRRRFLDKHIGRRQFGACEACDRRALLVRLVQRDGRNSVEWDLCEICYDRMVDEGVR